MFVFFEAEDLALKGKLVKSLHDYRTDLTVKVIKDETDATVMLQNQGNIESGCYFLNSSLYRGFSCKLLKPAHGIFFFNARGVKGVELDYRNFEQAVHRCNRLCGKPDCTIIWLHDETDHTEPLTVLKAREFVLTSDQIERFAFLGNYIDRLNYNQLYSFFGCGRWKETT